MGRLDPALRYILACSHEPDPERRRHQLVEVEEESPLALHGAESDEPVVDVLLEFRGSLAPAEEAGFRTRTVAGDVASGVIPLSAVEEVAALGDVVLVEASHDLEPELDDAVPESRVDQLHAMDPARRGAGVLVGIIDTGIHYQHGSFRNDDGSSRIVALWDQRRDPGDPAAVAGEQHPDGIDYGVEWRKADLDAALADADPLSVVRHTDLASNHGTHVAGIAAGNGKPLDPSDPTTAFVGVAPEADIAVVAMGGSPAPGGLGGSANAVDAVRYLAHLAVERGQPVAINMSLGSSIGGSRDGRTLLERAVDNMMGVPGRVMVKSAGNDGDKSRHLHGTMTDGGTATVEFEVVDPDPPDEHPPLSARIDFWYSFIEHLLVPRDEFGVSVTPPGGPQSVVVAPGETEPNGDPRVVPLGNGNRAVIDSVHLADWPWNIFSRIFVTLELDPTHASPSRLEAGDWTMTLHGTTVASDSGEWHAWIDRSPSPAPTFKNADTTMSITVPGTAQRIVTAAAYSAADHDLAPFSSRGPARDEREVPVPTIAAPGRSVTAPVGPDGDPSGFESMSGTSMAAPHVTGTLALILADHPHLTDEQLRDRLIRRARSDARTARDPHFDPQPAAYAWGAGKLDAKAAFDDTDSTCFVATAVYDDPNHPEVAMLRRLRDHRIAPDACGRRLALAVVSLYHRIGPPLALRVRGRPRLAALLRRGVFTPIARAVRRRDVRRGR